MSAPINLGIFQGINLNLIAPSVASDGKTYYMLDANGDGTSINSPGQTVDAVLRSTLDNLFNNGNDTTADSRTTVLGSYRLSLPTISEFQNLRSSTSGIPPVGWAYNPVPSGQVATYHVADQYGSNMHSIFGLSNGETYSRGGLEVDSISTQFVALKVESISPSYALYASSSSTSEGATATFTLSTTNVATGTVIPYTITGVSASDVVGGQLSGSVTVGANGQATIGVPLIADLLTEGSETLTVTAQGQSASVTINDTSLTPQLASYALSANSSSTSEGATATFTLSTTSVAAGTAVPYTVTGVSASDVVGGQLSGSVNVGTNGQATISVPLVADLFTEGAETLTVTAGGQAASVTVIDTSTSPLIPTYSLSASSASVAEGGVAVFNLTTTNIAAGNSVNYLISGISEADVVGGILSGSAIVDTNGRATISVPIAADSLTEGTETLRVIVSDKAATMSVADTSVATTTNTTNITNNITNNVTNNTTNNIAGSVNNTTNNFVNSFNRSLKVYDASVTNDVKVVVTRIGDITRIEGNQENNTLVGTDAIDRLVGGGGSDRFYSSKGNDVLDGGDGNDAVTFKGNASEFRVEKVGSNWQVRDTRTDPSVTQGEDTLTGIERVAFQDKVMALDTEGTAGKAYRVYKAAFNRDPMQGDTSGLGYWIGQMDSAMDLIEVSARFVDSKEFRDLYGTNPTNAQFLTKLYENVLGRTPEANGYNWWLNELNTNPSKTKAKVLADFSESGENQTGVAALIGNGITYEPWVG
jgi:hypothetical protein